MLLTYSLTKKNQKSKFYIFSSILFIVLPANSKAVEVIRLILKEPMASNKVLLYKANYKFIHIYY